MAQRTDLPVSAGPLLAEFAAAGLINWAGVHLAQTLGRRGGEDRPEVLLAIALALRAQQDGSVCLPMNAELATRLVPDLDADEPPTPTDTDDELPWPELDDWLSQVASSPLTTRGADGAANQRPLRLVGDLLYLERNWQQEETVRRGLLDRLTQPAPAVQPEALAAALDRAFAGRDAALSADQRAAVETAVGSWTSVIAGGPGTGKTTTIVQLLRVLDDLATVPVHVALASFTGKAATRMQESVDAQRAAAGATQSWQRLRMAPAGTLHKLLGSRPGRAFSRNAGNPLPHDLVIIDEMSMVSADLMAALMAALRPGTRLVLVGDPDQLSSVDAGAVLADIVSAGLPRSASERETSAVTELRHSHRFDATIGSLAQAIRRGDSNAALELIDQADGRISFVEMDPEPRLLTEVPGLAGDLTAQGQQMVKAALAGAASPALQALESHRLLCAHRHGRYGVAAWSRAIEQLLRREVTEFPRDGQWYPGRPIMVTRNAAEIDVSNGDTGVAISVDGRVQVAIGTPGAPRLRSPWLLDDVDSMYALTVHKSQGSEYDAVTLILPGPESHLLSRELLYTAVTRTRDRLRIVGTREAVARAIETPARRATGLAERLVLP